MAEGLENLIENDENKELYPDNLTDEQVNQVHFNSQFPEGDNDSIERTKIDEHITFVIDTLKNTETIKGWKEVERFLDNLGNDIKNTKDEATIKYVLTYFDMFLYSLGYTDVYNNYPQENLLKLKESVSVNEVFSIVLKIIDGIRNIFGSFDFVENKFLCEFWKMTKEKENYCNNNKEFIMKFLYDTDIKRLSESGLSVSDLFFTSDFKDICSLFFTEETAISFRLNLIGKKLKDEVESTQIEGNIQEGDNRGNIVFDSNKSVITSWGRDTKVELIPGEKELLAKLEGLDLVLSLDELVRLADFKNFIKYTYGRQEVKTTGFRYPFSIGTTRIIKKETLDSFCPISKNNDAREKIRNWLNK